MSTARRDEPAIARLFHLHSSHVRARVVDAQLTSDSRPPRYRTYPGAPRVDLPGRDFVLPVPLGQVLERRTSTRTFARQPLALELLGRLLYTSYGVRLERLDDRQWAERRPAPSAGALYPLELYIATQEVAGLADGLYHYDARAHQLEPRHEGRLHGEIAGVALEQQMVEDANLVIVIAAVFERTMWKYGQRGYRFVWLDAGHLGQNLYLAATALGLGVAAIGGFFDAELNHMLALPAGEEEAIYLLCIGLAATGSE